MSITGSVPRKSRTRNPAQIRGARLGGAVKQLRRIDPSRRDDVGYGFAAEDDRLIASENLDTCVGVEDPHRSISRPGVRAFMRACPSSSDSQRPRRALQAAPCLSANSPRESSVSAICRRCTASSRRWIISLLRLRFVVFCEGTKACEEGVRDVLDRDGGHDSTRCSSRRFHFGTARRRFQVLGRGLRRMSKIPGRRDAARRRRRRVARN